MTTSLHPLAARILALLASCALLSALAPPVGAAEGERAETGAGAGGQAAEPATVPGSLLVTTRDEGAADLRGQLSGRLGAGAGRAVVAALTDRVARVSVAPADTDAARRMLLALPGVVAVEPEHIYSYAAEPNDPRYGEQWAHELADAPGAWAITTGRSDVRIAIVDSGVDARHPELSDRVVAQERVVGSQILPGAEDNDGCGIGHGTMVAGIAAAAGDNDIGIAGVAWDSQIIDIALSAPGNSAATSCSLEEAAPTDGKVITALDRIYSGHHGRVDVVNLSLGGREYSGRCPVGLQSAIDRVRERGTVVVAATGNQADLGIHVPASCRGVIAVGAVDQHKARAHYSGMGRYVDVVAPGGAAVGVLTTRRLTAAGDPYADHPNPYTTVSGTSFAAPYVSGIVALLRSRDPGLSLDAVESILELTAEHPRGPGGHSHELGWGLVQAGAALRLLDSGLGVPAPRRHPAVRLAAGTGSTAPVEQAVAVSRSTFAPGSAAHAVIAREDDFADALAGSSLAYGIGPLLFARPVGSLPQATRAELVRTLPRNRGRTVYLLGGHGALDSGLEAELSEMGYRPVRLAGRVREETAVAVAREMGRPGGVHTEPAVIVATRGNWPDAVAAGAFGSLFGLPVLLTGPETLHGSTAAYLRELRDAGRPATTVYVVGGGGVVSTATADAAAIAAGGRYMRLGGSNRDATAVAVGEELLRQFGRAGSSPSYAIAIDLERQDSFAHALSASALAGNTGGVFVPIRGVNAPQRITDGTAAFACRLRIDGVVAGDVDLLPERLAEELIDVLEGSSPRC